MAALARRGIIRPPRGILAFPGTNPGFNPAHPAALNCQFSSVPLNGNFVNLLSGKQGALNGTGQAVQMDGTGGPNINFAGGNGNFSFSFPTTAFNPATFAAIFSLTSSSANSGIVSGNHAANTSYAIQIAASNASIQALSGGSTVTLFSSPPTGIPLFLAVSNSGTSINAVLCRLDTGVVFTATGVGGASTVGDGSFYIGNRGLNTRQLFGSVFAAMFSNVLLSPAQLRQWANDPWAFWYPKGS